MIKQKNTPAITAEMMDSALKNSQIFLSKLQLSQLWKFHQYLRKRNEELNMTRIHSFESMLRKHYIDCLIIVQILNKGGIKFEGRILDIGTGPGFPGIPLAIFLPEADFILAEGRHKRVEFLNAVVELLELKNTIVFGKRVHKDQNHNADIVITRAVENMADTMRHSMGNTTNSALYVFMKGPNCDDEISEMTQSNLYQLRMDESYTLPDSNDQRRLVVWQKNENCQNEIIASKDNAIYKSLKQLNQSKYIKKQNMCLVSGSKIIKELLDTNLLNCKSLIHEPQMPLPKSALQTITIEHHLFKELDIIGTNSALLLYSLENVSIIDLPATGIILALPLQNPDNLGTAIRSARAFGIKNMILFSGSAHYAHPRTIRASAGLSLTSNYIFMNSPLELIEKSDLPVFGLDMTGTGITEMRPPKDMIILTGEEGRGLYENKSIQKISIPIHQDVQSLNASIALSVLLYQITQFK